MRDCEKHTLGRSEQQEGQYKIEERVLDWASEGLSVSRCLIQVLDVDWEQQHIPRLTLGDTVNTKGENICESVLQSTQDMAIIKYATNK